MLVSKGILLNNNGHNDLDPDEVWGEEYFTNQDIQTYSRYVTSAIASSFKRKANFMIETENPFQKVTIQANMSVL